MSLKVKSKNKIRTLIESREVPVINDSLKSVVLSTAVGTDGRRYINFTFTPNNATTFWMLQLVSNGQIRFQKSTDGTEWTLVKSWD